MGIFFYVEPFSLSSKPQRAQHATFLLVQRQVGQKKKSVEWSSNTTNPPPPQGCCETSQLVHLESDTVTASQLALFCPLVE